MPKKYFPRLCETGKVKGIESGVFTRSKKNKAYAIKALELLIDDPSLSNDPKILWTVIQGGIAKKHNSQMDVVLALLGKDFIEN